MADVQEVMETTVELQ